MLLDGIRNLFEKKKNSTAPFGKKFTLVFPYKWKAFFGQMVHPRPVPLPLCKKIVLFHFAKYSHW